MALLEKLKIVCSQPLQLYCEEQSVSEDNQHHRNRQLHSLDTANKQHNGRRLIAQSCGVQPRGDTRILKDHLK